MELQTVDTHVSRRTSAPLLPGVTLVLFSGTIFLSAILLFSVQPMFAKMVLPTLGGSPSVWAVSMCFFQASLLAGYCWAHFLNRWAPARLAPLIHIALLAVAMLALPIGLPASAAEPPNGNIYAWLVVTLSLGVGLPFFCVSASAPLLQAWFARSGHPHAADPYFLYAASNLGSLLALLAYPFVIEPTAGVSMQAAVWTFGFALLIAAIAFCGTTSTWNAQADLPSAAPITSGAHGVQHWAQRLRWTCLAFVPSGLLVAFSTHIATDIASAPLLWVLPLAAFLITFVVVFRERSLFSHKAVVFLQAPLVAATLFGIAVPGKFGYPLAIIAGAVGFFVTMLVAHRELYEQRPETARLTEFYLWMSFGGVLGGLFSAILAPQIFSRAWEYPLLLLLGLACRPGVGGSWRKESDVRETFVAASLLLLAIVIVATAFGVDWLPLKGATVAMNILLASCGALVLASWARPFRQFACVGVMLAITAFLPSAISHGHAERSFFGVHRVIESPDGQFRLLAHGTTVHGAQRIRDAAGNPVVTPTPVSYYHPKSPMARGIQVARAATGKLDGGLTVGVVGLGSGSIACHNRAGENWTFYEIDPVVVRIARDPAHFTYLSTCQPRAEIVLGDARLTLAKAQSASIDYLLIDAFSSDAIPAHLLTAEALRLYLEKLSPRGVLVLHISNRYLDLISVVSATLGAIPGTRALLAKDATSRGFDAHASVAVYIAKTPEALASAADLPFILPLPAPEIAPWTDDWSDIITALWRNRR